jgi:hypothetical protein
MTDRLSKQGTQATLITIATYLGPIMCLTFLNRSVSDVRNIDTLFSCLFYLIQKPGVRIASHGYNSRINCHNIDLSPHNDLFLPLFVVLFSF